MLWLCSCGELGDLRMAATVEVEDAGITAQNDEAFNMDKGPVFECRLAVTVAPTDVAELFFGFTGENWGLQSASGCGG